MNLNLILDLNLISNVFEKLELKNKILTLYPELNAYYEYWKNLIFINKFFICKLIY